jgi:hypothetical protein
MTPPSRAGTATDVPGSRLGVFPESDGAIPGCRDPSPRGNLGGSRSEARTRIRIQSRRRTACGLLLCAAIGCSRGSPRPVPSEAEAAEIDRLRSLPYVSFATTPTPGARDGVVLLDRRRAAPGYRLVTLRALCRAELLDLEGRVVQAWQSRPCGHWGHAELVEGGDLLVVGRSRRGEAFLRRLDWQGRTRWRARRPAHHDVDLTPTGELLTILKSARQIELDGRPVRIADDRITRFGPAGLETLSLADLLGGDGGRGPDGWLVPTRVRSHNLVDLLHANSVEWMTRERLFGRSPLYAADHVLVSVRHQDLVAIADWEERALVWAWGRGELEGPHDASLLENGNVLVFDNGIARGHSRVVEVDPRTDEVVWQYRARPPESFFTLTLGGAQRLPNGNTLVAHSDEGEAFEVTAAGEVVWRYRTPHRDDEQRRLAIVRAKLYPEAMVEPLLARPDPAL